MSPGTQPIKQPDMESLIEAVGSKLKVCLVISSFRNDHQVESIIKQVKSLPKQWFDKIIVVDSQGTGTIPKLIAERGWIDVAYHSYDCNLGSAGNLAERLRLAAATDAEFAYTINHDGLVNPQVIATLLDYAAKCDAPIGAIYPLRYVSGRDGFDLTGRRVLPLLFYKVSEPPKAEFIEVHWSSSNGALYALAPVRGGVSPWADLWMGWEDLEYGWALERHGYQQVIVPSAVWEDPYEYVGHSVAGRKVSITNKPAWYAYYQYRNLILIARRHHKFVHYYALLASRLLLDLLLTAVFRPEKNLRFKLLLEGVIDGLRNKSGKGKLPL